jgi:hypothetical protein
MLRPEVALRPQYDGTPWIGLPRISAALNGKHQSEDDQYRGHSSVRWRTAFSCSSVLWRNAERLTSGSVIFISDPYRWTGRRPEREPAHMLA